MNKSKYFGVYESNRKFFTENLNPGKKVYDEDLININGKEFRSWNPKKSKLCAAFVKGLEHFGLNESSSILYLGAASGTTVSHVSDIITKGKLFALEFSPETFRDLYLLGRKNIIPLLEDAKTPEKYYYRVLAVDIVYQDIAQRNQVEIFEKNCNLFLKNKGYGLLCVKSRSIDVTEQPQKIFNEVKQRLKNKFRVIDCKNLNPLQKDHMIFLVQKY
jgi:fibrillarin-like pre-rRNA processing protein